MIDEKCLSGKFRGRRRTGDRALEAVANQRIDRCSPIDVSLFFPASILVCFHSQVTSKSVTKSVTEHVIFDRSASKSAQLG